MLIKNTTHNHEQQQLYSHTNCALNNVTNLKNLKVKTCNYCICKYIQYQDILRHSCQVTCRVSYI